MGTELRFEPLKMPGADLGPVNPLPDVKSTADIHAQIEFDRNELTEEETLYFNYGKVGSIVPYLIQDGYDRNKKPREFGSVVLENDHLKATFIPEFGGRLWSLYDKDAKRDLLHVNPGFQPANLALRNAWISGGVEWNIGMTGHTPYTVSQLFATSFKMSDGTPVLRMYEWERIRRVTYQIDAYLPEDSKFLFVHISLCNTRNEEVPIYWWSNIAVNETEDTRVLVPAVKAYSFDYTRRMTKVPVPIQKDGIDRSYTTRNPRSMDLFFDIPKEHRKWETALDGKGQGLIQTSTDLLQGRKLFMWGNSVGGHRWQEFLAAPGYAYLEIQAGLAHTQMEHLPMPANAKWEWLEAYGLMEADPKVVHGSDWNAATTAVDEELERRLPRSFMDSELERLKKELDVQVQPQVLGSGWAALEALRLKKEGKPFEVGPIVFDEKSLNEEQAAWLELLNNGVFPEQCTCKNPAPYLTEPEWRKLLEDSIAAGKSNNWHAWLQLGVMKYAEEDLAGAKAAWEKSLELKKSAWAIRNLAMLEIIDGNTKKAAEMLLEAVKLLPIVQLAIECAQNLIKADMADQFPEFMAMLPEEVKANGRIRTLDAHAAILRDEFDYALDILNGDIVVNDMREGEVLLSDLWLMLHERKIAKEEGVEITDELKERVKREYPIPAKLDFRMAAN